MNDTPITWETKSTEKRGSFKAARNTTVEITRTLMPELTVALKRETHKKDLVTLFFGRAQLGLTRDSWREIADIAEYLFDQEVGS